jgi:ribosomal protein S18 acetylase RimI-like enzyme
MKRATVGRMELERLCFIPIDLETHAAICVAFRRDSFVCSFGVDRFFDEAGPDGVNYLGRLRSHIARFPDGYLHVWRGDEVVGQLEMQIRDAPQIGYVNLFYLIEPLRGVGLGGQLQDRAVTFMQHHGVKTMQLSVSPSNVRALAYYRKHGWRNAGPRPGRADVVLMERDVPEDSDTQHAAHGAITPAGSSPARAPAGRKTIG